MSTSASYVASASSSPPPESEDLEPEDDDEDDADNQDEYEAVTIVEEFIALPPSPQPRPRSTPPQSLSHASSNQPSLSGGSSALPASTPITIVEQFIPQQQSSHIAASVLPSPALSPLSSYQPSSASSPVGSSSPPTPFALSDDDIGVVSFSTLASSISSLQTAIQRLSSRLEQPQPVYIVDTASHTATVPAAAGSVSGSSAIPPGASAPAAATHRAKPQQPRRPTRTSQPTTHRHSVYEAVELSSDESLSTPSPLPRPRRRHRPLPSRVFAVIDEQRRMMNDMMRVLHVQPYDAPCVHNASATTAAWLPTAERRQRPTQSSSSPLPARRPSVLADESDGDERIEEWDMTEMELPHRLSAHDSRRSHPIAARRASAAASPTSASPPRHDTRLHRTSSRQLHSPVPSPSPACRDHTVSPTQSSSTVLRRPRIHPPLTASLQAELERMRRAEERWRARAKTTRTQRMREEALETKKREEAEESRRREEEDGMEQRKRELVERAMVERWGLRGRPVQQSRRPPDDSKERPSDPQSTARLEWIRKRDGLSNTAADDQQSHRRRSVGGRRDSASAHIDSARLGRGHAGDGLLDHDNRADQWRYVDERRVLYSAQYLRTLGYDVVSEEEENERDVQWNAVSSGMGIGSA